MLANAVDAVSCITKTTRNYFFNPIQTGGGGGGGSRPAPNLKMYNFNAIIAIATKVNDLNSSSMVLTNKSRDHQL